MTKSYHLWKDNLGLSFRNRFKSTARKLAFLLIIALFSVAANAQVTTNSGSGLAATYPTLKDAIDALNLATISSPVTITLTGNETAPAGGYVINAIGTSSNLITIDGDTKTITAGLQTAGNLNDAIFKLRGCQYVTLKGFTMIENAANTTTAFATNNMTEWGVALLYYNATRGSSNCTILNNTISLNRTYANTFGIYSNSNHADVPAVGGAAASSYDGGNNNLKIYGNTISNVNFGIIAAGLAGVANYSNGLDIGGTSLATGNTISDFGNTGTFSGGYTGTNTTVQGIYVRYTTNYNVSYNSITSSNGGTISGTLRGVYVNNYITAPTGTITNNINNNDISLKSAVAVSTGTIQGIYVDVNTVNSTTTVNVNNNNFKDSGHTVVASGPIDMIRLGITSLFPDAVFNVKNNTFTNLSFNTTGSTTLINDQFSLSSTIESNAVVGTFARTGASGTFWCYLNNGSQTGGTHKIKNNNFSNITLAGTTAFFGIRSTGGSSAVQAVEVTGNTVSNVNTGSGTAIGIQTGWEKAPSYVNNNIVKDITGTGIVSGIIIGKSTGVAAGSTECGLNTISGLKTSGNFLVSGILNNSAVSNNIFKNKIYNIEANNASGTVDGIQVALGTSVNVYNNIIGDLRTPSSNLANPLVGINVLGGTTVSVDHNTVVLNGASTGALFGSSAFAVSATPTNPLVLRNNIFVNNSSVMGVGYATAIRATDATASKINASSNNNLVYGSTLFTDGTNSDTTLGGYQSRMTPRESVSISENPTFVSTTGADATFLHINSLVANGVSNAGQPIATITTDFDGEARNASTPDIGADEFALNGTTWLKNNAVSFWSNGAPTSTIDATIAANYSEVASITAKTLTVNNNAIVTIPSGNNVTITDAVTVTAPATFTLSNNANLIQINNAANTGIITVKRNSNPLFRLDYTLWSSPVFGAQTLVDFSPLTTVGRFYTYNPATDLYNITAPTTPFETGTGYLIRMPNTDPTTDYDAGTATLAYQGAFTGTPNNGTVTLGSVTPLVSDKYYAVGNPYPSTISAAAFLGANATDGTLYFWRKTNAVANSTGSAYATWTTLGSASSNVAPNNITPDGTIAVGQGFIVKTGVSATTLTFTNAMRTANNSAQFFKTKQIAQKDRVWLNLTNTTGAFSQALVGYMDGATQGVDAGIDGKYINDSPIALTSNINNEEYTIQGRPAFDASDVVALNFKTDVAGDYTIAIDHVDGLFATGQDVYLVDSKTGTETNLKEGAYTFNATVGTDNARFTLKYQKTLKVNTPAFNENSIVVYKNSGAIFINSADKAIQSVQVYDIQGRLIAEQNNVKSNTATIKNLKANNQVLIVKISDENNNVVAKKVLN